MKQFGYYRELPDVMKPSEVTAEFEAIIADPHFPGIPQEAVAVLSELSERQWNTYTLLDSGVREAVESLLERLWRDDDPGLAESLFAVAGRLGLPSFLSFVGQRSVAQMSTAVQTVVAECVAELQESIADPYSGLR